MLSARDVIINKLVNEYLMVFTTTDLLTMFNNATEERKQLFLDLILKDETANAGAMIRDALVKLAEQKAGTEADRILAENTLAEADLLRIMR